MFSYKSRPIWFALICITIILGLLSRHYTAIPLFIGDVLWATNIYFIVRFLFINKTIKWVILVSLLFCYLIEFSQLYKAPWINQLRHTLFGRLVLGEVFLWGDMLSYTVGVGVAVVVEMLIRPTKNNLI
jgi:Protein of unknown function (DUF2809)